MSQQNRSIHLASRPHGAPTPENFRLQSAALPEPAEGQLLLRTLYLSLDPYMRGRMSEGPSYAPPMAVGEVMVGGTVSRVVQSRHPDYQPGDLVLGASGWQEYALSDGKGLLRLAPDMPNPSHALGVLGMPGLTAYFGLLEVGKPKAGDVLVVSAASGAVGAVVGQIGRINGCRVIGVAGNDEKCAYVVDDLGFDAAINYKTQDVTAEFGRLCPDGIDVYFDNVGGPVLDAVFENLAKGARIAICGQISQYNAIDPPQGPRNIGNLLRTQSTAQGLMVTNYELQHEVGRARLAEWVRDGQLKYREDVVDGFENAPAAFIGLLRGENFGKRLVKVSE